MTRRIFLLTVLAMTAFAANSLLCRMALKHTPIDAASFTTIRLVSGALMLALIVKWRGEALGGNWRSALALFTYAAAFSFAYLTLAAATGALLLFGAVQATMLGYGFYKGERFSRRQSVGLICALGGLTGFLLPGASMPPLAGALLMLTAGIAWGIYSLRGTAGRGKSCDPTCATAGNFVRAALLALLLSISQLPAISLPTTGLIAATASGALASGLGYAVWYTALRELKASSAATVQLSVPIIAALGGLIFLNEALTLRLILAACAILGGIALVIQKQGDINTGKK